MAVSRLEQAGYPYLEGSHGISFSQLPVESDGLVIGGSGRRLYCVTDRSKISVTDLDTQTRWLSAAVNYGTISLNLLTRPDHQGEQAAHPDLFGAKFVAMALANFRRGGHDVRRYLSKWHPGSVNYIAFQRVKEATGDIVLAAKSTWTGKTAAANGFTELNLEDFVEYKEESSRCVRVIFRRPK
jgi:hypothetical protein